MSNPILRKAVLAASLLPTALSFSVGAQAQSPNALEEVVVSAQRREQSLQDVPISIQTFTNTAIETMRIENLVDVGNLVPNMTAVEGAGGTRSVLYQIRGLYASGTALGADSGVATYLDGVYIQGGSGSMVNYVDVARIEVLRGPQGTLFGRNTSGGAVSFITRDPSGEFGFKQTFSTGNLNYRQSKTRIDLPQWGPLSTSFGYTYANRDGDIKNSGRGANYDLSGLGGPSSSTSPSRLGKNRDKAMFANAKLELFDDLDVSYKFDYQDNNNTPLGVGVISLAPYLPPVFDTLAAPSFSARRPDSVNNALHSPGRLNSWGHNLTVTWSLTDSLTLKNIFGYRESEMDLGGYQLDGLGLGAPYAPIFDTTGFRKQQQTSDELQLIWETDDLTLTTGLLYYGLDQKAGGPWHMPNGYYGGQIYPGTVTENPSKVTTDSYAAYAQGEYNLTPEWQLVLGGRYTKDEKDYVDRTLEQTDGIIIRDDYNKEKATYLVGVNYTPADDILLYGKYGTGYISGGLVSSIPYDPEEAESTEFGAKTTWLDNTVMANVALFYVSYNDQQFGTAGSLVDPPVNASQVLVNFGDTEAYGVELETSWATPINGLTLGANAGYLHFHFRNSDLELLGKPVAKHLRPKYSALLSANYQTEPLFDSAYLAFHLDTSYRSRAWAITRPEVWYPNQGRNGEQWRYGGQIALEGINVADGELRFSLWGRNLTNGKDQTNMNTLGVMIAGTYEAARTYGLDVTYEY